MPSSSWRPDGRLLALLVLVGAAAVPAAMAFSGGITTDKAPDQATFNEIGCTACHGEPVGHGEFAATGAGVVSWTITDAEGNGPAGNAYEHGATYTIRVALEEANQPTKANHAGFNLRVSAGEFAASEGSQISPDGLQATHLNAGLTTWTVSWTAPEEGPAIFDLFVNDVDGDGANSPGDQVHRVGWFLTDESHALPGAAEAHEVHFGISLQQYWIGLIGLFGMIAVMVAGYVYLKFASPHNSDQKDR